jgi:L-fuculose-phosphate aldolase
VRCAAYATFGTQELSDAIIAALDGPLRLPDGPSRHGGVRSRLRARAGLAVELETLCEQYWRVLQLGAPKLLPAAEMARVLEKFASYGQQD